ncbi:MAG: S1 RNA-binding domain-containing protein, partial [bacterium]
MAENEQKNMDFSGTSISKSDIAGDFEVDALIQETIKEAIKSTPKKEGKTPSMAATPIRREEAAPTSVKPVEKKEEKVESKAPSMETSYQLKDYKAGDIVEGTISKIDPSNILVDIGYKSEGLVQAHYLADGENTSSFKIGQKISVFIERLENKEGYVELSKRRADEEMKWKKIYRAFKDRKALEGKVINVVKGGLVLEVMGIRGFIPASQVIKKPDENIESFKD